jgi:hypothetical protein
MTRYICNVDTVAYMGDDIGQAMMTKSSPMLEDSDNWTLKISRGETVEVVGKSPWVQGWDDYKGALQIEWGFNVTYWAPAGAFTLIESNWGTDEKATDQATEDLPRFWGDGNQGPLPEAGTTAAKAPTQSKLSAGALLALVAGAGILGYFIFKGGK